MGSADTGAREPTVLMQTVLVLTSRLDWLIGYLGARDDDFTAAALTSAREIRALAAGPDKDLGSAPAKERQDARDDVYETAMWVLHDFGAHLYWCEMRKTIDAGGISENCTCGFKDALQRLANAAREARFPNQAENLCAGVGEARPAEPPASEDAARLAEIRERVDAAEQEGWYGYGEEARADVRWLLALARVAVVHDFSDDPPREELLRTMGREPGQPQTDEGDPYFVASRAMWREKALAAEAECGRLREELRIREESQIPVIPRAAQKRLEAAEAEAGRLREQLDALTAAAFAVIEDSGAAGTWAELDSALGAALGVVGPPTNEGSALGQTASETRGGDQ